MSAGAAAGRYLGAWYDRDPAALAAAFARGGTYTGPHGRPLTGSDIAAYAAEWVAAIPDLRRESDPVVAEGNWVFARWRLRGTPTGPLPGTTCPPSGGAVHLDGVDVIESGRTGITRVTAIYDRQGGVEQLGLRPIAVPRDEPPMRFGWCSWTDAGAPAVPGALALTWIETADPADEAEVEERGGTVVGELAAAPGFLAFLGTTAGRRGHTVTAWTSVAAAEVAVAGSPAHREARRRFRRGELGRRGFTSLWVPHRLNPQYARCPSCTAPIRIRPGTSAGTCPCGGSAESVAYL